jgi:Recombination endonuclease VII
MSLDKSRRDGISSWCKECRKQSARTWGIKYPERAEISRTNRSVEYKTNPPKYEYMREYMLKRRYGISQEEYNTMFQSQAYACAVCKKSDLTYHLHVDHCHTTGKVRGLLCSPCNVYLGCIKDNPEVLKRALSYLGEHHRDK